MNRKDADFTVTVFPHASHLLIEATIPSDEELPRLQSVAPGFYDFVSDWLLGRLRSDSETRAFAELARVLVVQDFADLPSQRVRHEWLLQKREAWFELSI